MIEDAVDGKVHDEESMIDDENSTSKGDPIKRRNRTKQQLSGEEPVILPKKRKGNFIKSHCFIESINEIYLAEIFCTPKAPYSPTCMSFESSEKRLS